MNDNTIYPKSSFLMCITTLRKVEIQKDDSESKTWQYQVVESKWKKCNGKDFKKSFFESRDNGENITIQIVNERPEKFVINQLYMLATRDRMWVWVEE